MSPSSRWGRYLESGIAHFQIFCYANKVFCVRTQQCQSINDINPWHVQAIKANTECLCMHSWTVQASCYWSEGHLSFSYSGLNT